MTVVVGVINNGTVVMAADSAFVDEEDGVATRPLKLVTLPVGDEQAVIGVAGSASSIPLVRWTLVIPAAPSAGSEDAWAQSIAEAATLASRDAKISDKDGIMPGRLLLAFRGRLWTIEDMLAMPVEVFGAIGSGSAWALGALAVLIDTEKPKRAARRAVEIACAMHVHCRPPVVVVEV